ncbi:epoxide hydrolase [bacterium]|nr:MAG: epoxide hydrolase [bacterium]
MQPFQIDVPDRVLEDLQRRLRATRWPDEMTGKGWKYGTDSAYLRPLCEYWADGFDWRAQEAKLNGLDQFTAEVDGISLHFVHQKSRHKEAIPLLLSHGWPDSFWRFEKLIPLLTDPEDSADAFHIVAPSLPGYGFSGYPSEPGWNPTRIAAAFWKLMTGALGYKAFGAHGGDWGASITEALAHDHPESLLGIHLTDIPFRRLFEVPPDDLSDAEKEFLQKGQAWSQTYGGYAIVQGNEPQTLAYGLNDSPAGLAGWILDKFQKWSDCDGNLDRSFTKDELLTNLTIYWATGTAASASRLYFETARDETGGPKGKIEVPMGAAIFPKDLIPAPREFAERIYDVRRWTEMPKGGHFAALEEPELLAQEIQGFFRPLRTD